jgi:hypothetical protein
LVFLAYLPIFSDTGKHPMETRIRPLKDPDPASTRVPSIS